jgi:hypothetical protein
LDNEHRGLPPCRQAIRPFSSIARPRQMPVAGAKAMKIHVFVGAFRRHGAAENQSVSLLRNAVSRHVGPDSQRLAAAFAPKDALLLPAL